MITRCLHRSLRTSLITVPTDIRLLAVRRKRCLAGTSPPISGCLAPSRRGRSTQKPGQCRHARTAGSECPHQPDNHRRLRTERRLWRDGRGQWSLRSVITGWDQVALPSAARCSRNELISGCKHPASNALGCRNRDCDAGVVLPLFRGGPNSGAGCPAPSAFRPAWGRPNRDLSTCPRLRPARRPGARRVPSARSGRSPVVAPSATDLRSSAARTGVIRRPAGESAPVRVFRPPSTGPPELSRRCACSASVPRPATGRRRARRPSRWGRSAGSPAHDRRA